MHRAQTAGAGGDARHKASGLEATQVYDAEQLRMQARCLDETRIGCGTELKRDQQTQMRQRQQASRHVVWQGRFTCGTSRVRMWCARAVTGDQCLGRVVGKPGVVWSDHVRYLGHKVDFVVFSIINN